MASIGHRPRTYGVCERGKRMITNHTPPPPGKPRNPRTTAFYVCCVLVELLALPVLAVISLAAVWGQNLTPGPFTADEAAPYTHKANQVLLLFAVAIAIPGLIALVSLLAGHRKFAAAQFLLFVAVALVAVLLPETFWASHATNPLPGPPNLPPNYTPCYSGSGKCG